MRYCPRCKNTHQSPVGTIADTHHLCTKCFDGIVSKNGGQLGRDAIAEIGNAYASVGKVHAGPLKPAKVE
jgi:transposase-like protein